LFRQRAFWQEFSCPGFISLKIIFKGVNQMQNQQPAETKFGSLTRKIMTTLGLSAAAVGLSGCFATFETGGGRIIIDEPVYRERVIIVPDHHHRHPDFRRGPHRHGYPHHGGYRPNPCHRC
jgi:hypothetical protein